MAWSQRKKLGWFFVFFLVAVAAALSPFAVPALLDTISLKTIEERYADGSQKCRYTVHRWGPGKGVPHGRFSEYYRGRGKRLEKFYVDGKLHGILTEWNMQGEIFAQYDYEHGVLVDHKSEAPWFEGVRAARDLTHGQFVEHDPSTGNRIHEYSYLRGAPHGIWTDRDATGNVTRQRHYERGELVEERSSAPWFH